MKSFLTLLLAACATAAFGQTAYIAYDRPGNTCGEVDMHIVQDGIPLGIQRAVVVLPGRRVNLTPIGTTLDFPVTMPAQGAAVPALDLASETLDLNPAQVKTYLDAIAAPQSIRAQWDAHPGRWREKLTRHAKALVRCGDEDKERLWNRDTEMGFELVAQEHDPMSVKAGETASFVIVKRGHNVFQSQPVVLTREGGARVEVVNTDQNGIATFKIPAPGRYIVSTTVLSPADGKDLDWIGDSTTLAFEVK